MISEITIFLLYMYIYVCICVYIYVCVCVFIIHNEFMDISNSLNICLARETPTAGGAEVYVVLFWGCSSGGAGLQGRVCQDTTNISSITPFPDEGAKQGS